MPAILEDVKEIVVDKWGTLNTVVAPGKLPLGQSPNSTNVWVDEKPGSVVTSKGYRLLGTNPSGSPNIFAFNYFISADGTQFCILSDGDKIWSTTNFVDFTELNTGWSPFTQIRAAVIRDRLWLTNGVDHAFMTDTVNGHALDGTGGFTDAPIAKYIAYHDERVWLFGLDGEPSNLAFTRLTDSSGTEQNPIDTGSFPSDNRLQISEGDNDFGTGLLVYRGYLYCFKQYSIWRIVGYDEYTYTRVKTRATTGTRFAESIQVLDNLVYFIGVDGLYTFDGEETTRISDIIDPDTDEPGVFSFRKLQQPLLNNTFWDVREDQFSDDDGGSTALFSFADDKLTLAPADDTEADFAQGIKNDITETANSGFIQLSNATTGVSSENVALNRVASVSTSTGTLVGAASSVTDGSISGSFGVSGSTSTYRVTIPLPTARIISRIIFRGLRSDLASACTVTGLIGVSANNGATTGALTSFPASSVGVDYTVNFTPASLSSIVINFIHTGSSLTMTEIEIYPTGFEVDGSFLSKTIDFGEVPASFGTLAADIDTNGETYQFYTRSSADGISWDPQQNVANGGAITSTLRRYLKWGVDLFSSTGTNSPVIDKVYVGGSYLSPVHDTGGSLFGWAALQASMNKAGQTITMYYRAATTDPLVDAQSWTEIQPGAVPNTAITNTFIQIRIFMSTDDATEVPSLSSFTVNWIIGTASGVNTTQNVASFVWANRYWLSAATVGAAANDIVVVRGKSTFESPWHTKDFRLLSFTRFQNNFIGCSSRNGEIYKLETGYSKEGTGFEDQFGDTVRLNSVYETGDFSQSGFFMRLYEMLVTADRLGPYPLYISVSVDGGLTWTDYSMDLTRPSGGSLSFTKKFNFNFRTDSFRLRVTTTARDNPFSVDEIRVRYRLLPMRGSLG